jgi:DNA-binding beta-propeller fold protein YncE
VLAPIGASAQSGQAYRDGSRLAASSGLLAIVQPRYHAVVLLDSRPGTPRPLFAFGRYGRRAGELAGPTGVALDARRGLVYVSDTGNDRIEVFRLARDARGQVTSAAFIKAIGRHGSRPGELRQPAGLALDQEGHLYVCDTGNGRVQIFDEKLAFVRQWGGGEAEAARLAEPVAVAIDPQGKRIYVADRARLQVQAFDRTGTLLASWGTPARPDTGVASGELAFPFAIAASHGFVYVSDSRRQDVQKFRLAELIATLGRPGNQDGQFFQPEGIEVIDDKRVVVIDQGGHRGQVFSPEGAFLVGFPIPAGDLYPWATPAAP